MTLWLALACAPDLRPDDGPTADTGEGLVQTSEGGVTSVTIDATSETAWVPYDFPTAAIREPGQLQFQRYRVRLGEGVQAAWIEGVDFDEVDQAPTEGWMVDASPLEADEDYVFNAWYTYDEATHTLAPADRVAVIRTAQGDTVKIGFDAYYDDVGTPAYVAFHWSFLTMER